MRILHAPDRKGGGRRVFLAVPAYGNVPPEFTYSLWCARGALSSAGVEVELVILAGGCHVDDSRNQLATMFLRSDCHCLVFIDDDTRFKADELVRLVLHKEDVVAGVCPKKIYPLDFAYRPKESGCGVVEVDGVGTAFVKISRAAMQAVADKSIKYKTKIGGKEEKIYQIFERTTDEDGNRWGGDYTFCRKWAACGGKIYVDTEMSFGHIGPHEWEGHLGMELRERSGETVDYLASMLSGKMSQHKIEELAREWGNQAWQSDVELLSALDMLARDCEGSIMEFGSGLSTLVMASSGKKVETIEHTAEWANKVLDVANAAGFDVSVIDAQIDNGWYAIKANAEGVGLVFVDGPPRSESNRAIIADRISGVQEGCIFVVDDDDGTVTGALSAKFNIKFRSFGKYAVGKA